VISLRPAIHDYSRQVSELVMLRLKAVNKAGNVLRNVQSFPSTLRSCEITLLPVLGKYLHAVLLEELFVKFDAIALGLLEIVAAVKLHRVVPTKFVEVLI
jgi:hypothetical protein